MSVTTTRPLPSVTKILEGRIPLDPGNQKRRLSRNCIHIYTTFLRHAMGVFPHEYAAQALRTNASIPLNELSITDTGTDFVLREPTHSAWRVLEDLLHEGDRPPLGRVPSLHWSLGYVSPCLVTIVEWSYNAVGSSHHTSRAIQHVLAGLGFVLD